MKHTVACRRLSQSVCRKLRLFWLATALVGTNEFAGAATVQVTIQEAVPHFNPLSVTIHPGDTVEWIWSDQFRHSATSGKGQSGQPDGVFNSGRQTRPHTFSFTFQELGRYEYYCAEHRTLNTSGVWPEINVVLDTAQLLNVSTRLRVQSGQNAMIGGFIITGNASKRVIIRAIGPSLSARGVSGVLADPTVSLNGSGGAIGNNDNWKDSQQAEIQSTGVSPSDDRESAIVATLPPGSYTAIVEGKDQTTGVGLVEVYDLNQPVDSKLANISTRGVVEPETNVMIGGFILGKGTAAAKVVIRAIGPSLSQSGISGALSDPILDLRDGNGELVRSNNNWKESQQAEIEASGIPPQNDLEAAIVATLAPAPYTAVVAGHGGTSGVGLVEVYQLP